MYQVNFSEQSMVEFNKLDIREQMNITDIICSISKEDLAHPSDFLQSFNRNNTIYYRVRANDFRIYFELRDDTLFAHYILHKNTLSDLFFGPNYPIKKSFWLNRKRAFGSI